MGYYFETKDLVVGYHKSPLIRNISIGIEQGEIMTLIGPNGSGKSTILKSISKHLTTLGGTVELDGMDMQKLQAHELSKKMSVLLTERIRPELMLCRDVVAAGRYPYTGVLGVLSEEDRQKVDEAMELVRIQELADRDFQELSDGQRQRVLLARAICQEPEILVLDEPTSYLDIRYKLELLEILRSMAKEKQVTVVMSLHEIELAKQISDKVVCVKGDEITQFGTPEEIFTAEIISHLFDIPEDMMKEHEELMWYVR